MAVERGTVTEADSLHSDYALGSVPEQSRRGLYELMAVWVGWAVSVSGFLVGGTVGAGLQLGSGLLALLVGNAVLVVIGTLVGLIGFRTGMTTYSICRSVFGKRGSIVVSLLLGIVAMGFIGVLLDAFAGSIAALIPGIPKIVSVVVFSALVTLTAIYGFRGLATLSKIAAPALWILMALAVVAVVSHVGSVGNLFAAEPSTPITFTVGVGAAVATWVTGAALASDISRYASKASHVLIGAAGGYLLGAFLLEAVSAVTAAGVGNGDIVIVMQTLGLLIPGILVLVLALWTTSDNNIYSSGLAFTNVGELIGLRLSKPTWTVVSIAIAVLVSLLGLAANFLVWLRFISIAVAPFAGVILAHFWLVNKGRGVGQAPDGSRWTALVAWLAATIFAYYYRGWVPAVPALVLAALIYWGLSALAPQQAISGSISE